MAMAMKSSTFAAAAVYAVVLMFAIFGLASAVAPSPSPEAGAGSMGVVPSVGASLLASVIAFLAYMFF